MGLVFPDLFRDLYRKHIPSRDINNYSETAFEFIKGMRMHIERDKFFHHCDYFHKGEELLKVFFQQKMIIDKIPRSWFMAHVLTELLTDKFLVIHEKNCVERFYEDMYNTMDDIKTVNELFKDSIHKTVFLSRMRLIHQDKFIFAYANNEKLIAALWRVYERAGIGVAMEVKNNITPILLEIVNELNNNVNFNWVLYNRKQV